MYVRVEKGQRICWDKRQEKNNHFMPYFAQQFKMKSQP